MFRKIFQAEGSYLLHKNFVHISVVKLLQTLDFLVLKGPFSLYCVLLHIYLILPALSPEINTDT